MYVRRMMSSAHFIKILKMNISSAQVFGRSCACGLGVYKYRLAFSDSGGRRAGRIHTQHWQSEAERAVGVCVRVRMCAF